MNSHWKRPRISLFAGAALSLALIAFAPLVSAQSDPETERGTHSATPYRVEGLDQVNLFNGNITLNIPIGPTYRVNGTLSYGFMASYATNPWEKGEHELIYPESPEDFTYDYKFPARRQNAGLGWVVNLGYIYSDNDSGQTYYVAPDGGEHALYDDPQPNAPAGGSYTRDSTYLRYQNNKIEFPNGNVHTFSTDGRLLRMDDRHGNWVTVNYTTRGQLDPNDLHLQSPVWVITDSVRGANNTQRVYFRPNWAYREDEWEVTDVPHDMVDKIVLTAFDDPATPNVSDRATYVFNYDAPPTTNPTASYKTSRKCAGWRPDPYIDDFEYVSLLASIDMPHGVTYSMKYDRGNGVSCSTTAGNITRLILPSGGVIDWTYQDYGFRMARSTGNTGVSTRTVRENQVTGAPVLGTTTYVLGTVATSQPYPDYSRLVTQKDGSGAIINATKSYFGGCNDRYCTYWKEYGLPFTRGLPTSNNAFLSSETQVPASDGSLQTKREHYVRYEGDRVLHKTGVYDSPGELNQRLVYEKTIYRDDNDRWSDVTYSEYDGLGHYRKAVVNGNFASSTGDGYGDKRTTYTNYNPAAGIYKLDANGNLEYGFTMPDSTDPWILTRYDKQWVMEPAAAGGDVYSATAFCFDENGFLTKRRVYKNYGQNPTADAADLLAVFTPTSNGNLLRERYWGGSTDTAAPAHNCSATESEESYRIDHTWSHGALESSYYVDESGDDIGAYIADNVIDQNTGLVKQQRRFRPNGETGGLPTTLNYDLLGRLNKTTSTRVKTEYQYALSPPRIVTIDSAVSGGAELRRSSVTLDILGRPILESRSMPGDATSTRTTQYNALGWKTAVTDWGATAPTLYSYDPFGRMTKVKLPGQSDGDAMQVSYTGVSSMQRTTRVRTGGNATSHDHSDAVTNETYDRHGRLTSVKEPGPTSSSRPLTRYTYDLAGRLIKVCSNASSSGDTCGQTRVFAYDSRGLLSSETHPEGGTTNYKTYDARGHLRRRHGASEYTADLTFEYDRAERLTDVKENLAQYDDRPLKHYVFGTSNSSGNYANGRVVDAIRFNWSPNDYRTQVRETYAYGDPDGNVSFRRTSDHICLVDSTEDCRDFYFGTPLFRVFEQEFTYDELGATKTVKYPDCEFSGCTSTDRTATNTYDEGLLTAVTWTGGGTNSITYHPSGLIDTVSHDNLVVDTQTPDPNLPARPESIVTTGATAIGNCVKPTFSEQPASQTITSGSTATLSALASGEEGGDGVSYQWWEGIAPQKTNSVGINSASFTTPALTTTKSYWVEASNQCGEVHSVTATVSICVAPQVDPNTEVPNETITRSKSITLSVALSNASAAAPVSYQWYTVTGSALTAIPGATAQTLRVTPENTTTYRVRVSNACGTDESEGVVTVLDPPTIPASVTATYNPGNGSITVSWIASTSDAGIASYLVERQPGNVHQPVTGATSYTDTASLVAGTTYVYTVRSRDTNSVYSAKSLPDIAIVKAFSDDPLITATPLAGTPIRGIHISELRQAVDSVRAAAGLDPAWTNYNAPTGSVDDQHFIELREFLNDARDLLFLPHVSFNTTVGGGQTITRVALTDLRNGVK